jgi:hypothetical protein
MDPQRAWTQTREQLQSALPKAQFDTWVRDARLEAFEDGAFNIAVQNAYARDWLEERLGGKMEQLLSTSMGEDVAVYFVNNNGRFVDIDLNDESVPSKKRTKATKPDIAITPQEYDTVYEQVVQPHRQAVLPGYFRRHLRVMGPKMAWMYVAFRQAAYQQGARLGVQAGTFSGKQIAALCGISDRAFWYRVERKATWEKLDGLVTHVETEPQWQESDDLRRLPLQYHVAMTLPLTAADARSLSAWLGANIERYDGPEGVLKAACQAPLDELIPPEAKAGGWKPMTIRQVVFELFGALLPESQLASLSSSLQSYIMPPKTDTIHITSFFLEHVLPHLSAGEAWLLTLLRDRCYVNKKTGEVRNTVTVTGGYKEMAAWLGFNRPKTIGEWLSDPDSVLAMYLHHRQGDGRGEHHFDVLLEEIPSELLTIALDDDAWDAFRKTMQDVIDEKDSPQAATKAARYRRDLQYQGARFSVSRGATCSMEGARLADGMGATCSIEWARFSVSMGATCRVKITSLTSFKPPHNHLKDTSTTTSPPTAAQVAGRETAKEKLDSVVLGDRFDLSVLFSLNNVNPTSRKELQQKKASPLAFVSHLLYAASPAGSTIANPISYTVNQLKHDPKSGAGAEYDQLARLKPEKLAGLIAKALDDSYQSRHGRRVLGYADALTGHAAWDNVMLNAPQLALSELGLALFGVRLIDRTETIVTTHSTYEQT